MSLDPDDHPSQSVNSSQNSFFSSSSTSKPNNTKSSSSLQSDIHSTADSVLHRSTLNSLSSYKKRDLFLSHANRIEKSRDEVIKNSLKNGFSVSKEETLKSEHFPAKLITELPDSLSSQLIKPTNSDLLYPSLQPHPDQQKIISDIDKQSKENQNRRAATQRLTSRSSSSLTLVSQLQWAMIVTLVLVNCQFVLCQSSSDSNETTNNSSSYDFLSIGFYDILLIPFCVLVVTISALYINSSRPSDAEISHCQQISSADIKLKVEIIMQQ